MESKKLKSFNKLKHKDKIISPIDKEVTEFYVDKSGEKFLASNKSLFPLYQFNAEDFYIYDEKKEVGEIDSEYFMEVLK